MHRVSGTTWRVAGTALAVFVSVGFVWAQAPAGQAPAAPGTSPQTQAPAPGGGGRAGGGGRGGRGMTPSQLRSTPAEQLTAKFRDPKWKAPRTPWGHPDLQGEFSTDDMNTRARVGAGSWAPMSWNIFAKIGTMKSSMPMTARIAITKTTTG